MNVKLNNNSTQQSYDNLMANGGDRLKRQTIKCLASCSTICLFSLLLNVIKWIHTHSLSLSITQRVREESKKKCRVTHTLSRTNKERDTERERDREIERERERERSQWRWL